MKDKIDFDEAEYALSNCIRITLNVETYKTEVNTSRNGEKWIPVTDYVKALKSHEIISVLERLKKEVIGENESTEDKVYGDKAKAMFNNQLRAEQRVTIDRIIDEYREGR